MTASSGNGQLTLTWNSVTGATAYNLYRSTATGVSKATGTQIANVTSPYVDTGLANGTTYFYVVTAVNSFGESVESGEMSATPGSLPPAPTGVVASPGDAQVTLTWGTVTGAMSYNVYQSTSPTVSKNNGTKFPGVTSPYNRTGLTNGTTYHYVVTAVNSIGEGADSSVVSATPGTITPAPTGVTATSGDGQVTLGWTPVTGATSYNIYYSTISGVNKGNGTIITNVTNPYTKTGLTNWTTYYFVVTALKGALESAESSPESSATPKAWIGTKQIGTSANDHASAIAINSTSGDIYLTGWTDGNLDGKTNAGYSDAFLIKYDKNGEKKWTLLLGTSGYDYGKGVAVDSSGNIYVTGDTRGAFPGNTNMGGSDFFLAKYNSAGDLQWIQQEGTSGYDYGKGVAVDSSGNAYVTGDTTGAFPGKTNQGFSDFFLAKYNSAGVLQWIRQEGTSSSEGGEGVAVDRYGNALVTVCSGGAFIGWSNLGGTDIFFLPYYSGGTYWYDYGAHWGTSGPDCGLSVAVDMARNAYVTGRYNGIFSAPVYKHDIFLTKLTYAWRSDFDNYDVQWTQQLGTAEDDYGTGVAVDSNGNVYLTGSTHGGLDGNIHMGEGDIFLTKYNTAGTRQWTVQPGSSNAEYGTGIAVDSSGNVYVTGVTSGGLDGNTNAGGTDIFLMKYDSNGNKK